MIASQMYDVNFLYHSEADGGGLSFKQEQQKMNKLCFSGPWFCQKRVVNDLRSKTKGSHFKYDQWLGAREEGGSGKEELEPASTFSCCPVIRNFSVKRKPR